MRLHGICYYRSKSEAWTDKWRNEDYSALQFVKAIKGIPFNGACTITQNGVAHTIASTPAGRAMALNIAAGSLAGKIHAAGYENVAIVPVPSSDHIDPCCDFTGRQLVTAIQAKHANYRTAPVLFFDQVMPKSRGGGGSRAPSAIEPHLRVVDGPLPPSIVLLDDVCTSGGHLIAAARFLAKRGVVVADAFVVGRTAWERPAGMFSVVTENLDTAEPFDVFDF